MNIYILTVEEFTSVDSITASKTSLLEGNKSVGIFTQGAIYSLGRSSLLNRKAIDALNIIVESELS